MNLEINEIPWNRLVGWYHRGDFFLENLRLLEHGTPEQQKKAFKMIEWEIEHQGGIISITPFAVQFLIRALKGDTVMKTEIKSFLTELQKAVKEGLMYIDEDKIEAYKQGKFSLWNLLNEKYLLPKNFNTENEEIIWDEFWEELQHDEEHWLMTHLATDILLQAYFKEAETKN